VLTWLSRDGWPATVDASPKWSVSGLAQPLSQPFRDTTCNELCIPGMRYRDEWFLCEANLCRFAMQASSTACLEALLDAGCRSDWMCPMAALEGREPHLALAAERGCACDARTMYVAARACNLDMLRAAHRQATLQAGPHCGGNMRDCFKENVVVRCIDAAAQGGSVECLGVLLDWFKSDWSENEFEIASSYAAEAAAGAGHVSCLQELTRYASSCFVLLELSACSCNSVALSSWMVWWNASRSAMLVLSTMNDIDHVLV
jgi:hypothetical protein